MTAKEFFSKPGVLLTLGILIGAGLLWLSSGLTTKNWNLFLASNPNTGGGAETGPRGGGAGGRVSGASRVTIKTSPRPLPSTGGQGGTGSGKGGPLPTVDFYVCSDSGVMGFGNNCEDCLPGDTCWVSK